ncbi:hypothetical protein D0Z06_17045 [Geodermatophilus marinus]|nr:hypothetical protein D0Z06_17045 [Geodermatophilus sp. LHW52908]
MSAPIATTPSGPDVSWFRRRVVRSKPAPVSHPVRTRTWKTIPEWSTPSLEEWEAMPNGTRVAITAGEALQLTLECRGERWTVLARTEVPSRALVGLACAPRVRVRNVEGQEAGA